MILVSVKNSLGVKRSGCPARIGVPFPRGLLSASSQVDLFGEDDARTQNQQRVLARWPNGSTKWLLLDFLANVDAHSEATYRLEIAARSAEKAPSQDLAHDDGGLQVDTGVLEAFFPSSETGSLFRARPAGWPNAPVCPKIKLIGPNGEHYECRCESVSLEENGPLRSTVAVVSRFSVGKKQAPVIVTSHLTFFSGYNGFVAEIDMWNPLPAKHPGNRWDLGDKGSFVFGDLSVEVTTDERVEEIRYQAEPSDSSETTEDARWCIYQDSSGGDNWQSPNHIDARAESTVSFRGYEVRSGAADTVIARGNRAQPLVRARTTDAWICLAVDQFWQNFPKAIRCSSDGLSIGLFPQEAKSSFELQGGERKRHTVFFEFGGSADLPAAGRMARGLEISIDPQWVGESGTVSYLCNKSDADDKKYEDYVTSILDGPCTFSELRETIDEFGWRHFGDLYADHEAVGHSGTQPLISHYNNQYDFVFAAGVQFLRSGDFRWHQLMREAARHHVDIDIYHTDQDRPVYNRGLFWHTDHYKDAATATHRTYSRHNASGGHYGGGPSDEHNYTSGFVLHYYLSGDSAAKNAVLGLADWVIAMDEGQNTVLSILNSRSTGKASATALPDYHKPGRGAGNSINALLDGYELSGDRRYMTKAEELILRCIHPEDDVASMDLDEPELHWSYLVFLQVLGKFLNVKQALGETDYYFYYARDSLLQYARWMLEGESPYKDVLHKVELPTETWPAQDIRKCHVFHLAAVCSREPESRAFYDEALLYYRRCLDDLLGFETAYLTRPRVILAAYGYVHDYFLNRRASGADSVFNEQHCYSFGEPTEFEAQSDNLAADLRRKARLFADECRRLIRDQWASLTLRFSNRDKSQR